MNAEQKQQAKQLIADWTNVSKTSTPAVWFLNGDCMAGFLQELVDAPEPEPVLTLTVSEAGGFRVWATNTCPGYIPAGEHLLYLAPPAPSVPELEEYDAGFLNDFGGGNVGWWQDYIRAELGRAYEFYCDQLSAAPTPAEPPADVARDAARYRWLLNQAWFQQAADRFDFTDGGMQIRFEKCMDEFIDAAIEREKMKGGEA